ncbi:uncharacterized protein LOC143293003 isoform X2 [Babylonia areolata]|uniref:uncharacterized protein LOC143293003 isoform X2 n=1 Tax=Babylonia areolata TaxID=304850 RepID=UPI003FD59B77
MVQLTIATGEQAEMAPPAAYSPPFLLPIDQLPQTSLGSQSGSAVISPTSQSPVFPSKDTGCDKSSGHDALLMNTTTFIPPDPCLSPDNVLSSLHSPFTPFSSIDTIPVTMLTASGNITTDCGSQNTCGDLCGEVGKTFEVIPVSEGCGYGLVDNAQPSPSFCTKNVLQVDTRTDSVDSLLESRGYTSDSSDIYMNSDYTDTVTSADSSTFLLPAKDADLRSTDGSDIQHADSSDLASNFYSNEAFCTESRKELMNWSSEDSVTEQDTAVEARCAMKEWEISVPEEDSGAMADKEDEDEDPENKALVSLPEGSALENLVNHLAEQHPQEVVDIRIEVLDQPVYTPLTQPLEEEERNWLQSTESLHHYKLLKQGRSSTLNSLRVHALSNLRANTMHNLHERSSFLNLTAASVSNLGSACRKALSYVRADMEFGSMMSLGNAFSSSLLPGKQQPPHDLGAFSSEKKGGQAAVASGCHTRNVLYMALLVTLLLISINTTRNLQSSLNQEGGVGIICLAVMFASYTLGSLLSPVMVQGQGVKACVILGLVLQLMYVAANLYPVLWLMLPASLGGGASMALIWNAMSTYIVLLAHGEADYKQKSYQRVSDKYFGFFCLIYQSNLIVGNLIASLVLTFASGVEGSAPILVNSSEATSTATPLNLSSEAGLMDGNNTDAAVGFQSFDPSTESHYHLCGAEYCHHFVVNQESSMVPARTVYLLFGIFMFLVVCAILMAVFLLEPLSPRPFRSSSTTSPWHSIKHQILSLVKFSRNAKFLLMLPLLLYSSMQFSFVCSEVMMAYVTCPVGVWLVGYSMIGYGVCCSLGSYLTQALVPRIGRGFFIGIVLEKIKVLV